MDQATQEVLFMLIQEQQEFRKKKEQVMSTLAKTLDHFSSLRSCHEQEILVDECEEPSKKCGVKEELQNQEEDVKSQHEVKKEINEALIVKELLSGKLSLDVVLKKIGTPDARWKYSRGENAVLQSIACTDLNPEARIWQQIIADYILPSTHATHIKVRVAVLLWAILEGKRISILPLIRDSMWKVTQQQKYNIPFLSLITRLATLSGVERRPTDQMSVLVNKQPFLPYGDYDGPPQKKRKTTEPPSSSIEPLTPPTPLMPTPRLQTSYELGREILETLNH
ncbi:hypothetical protein Ahy_A07g035950 [Arachis hypogaea]|uniref:Putative plant transposon protein domain-containing protein n=1 Tax=Arachis hypogaea TaxID=3818 RepID=A0A445CEU4_ARAHY|nr:hypothetical protein Ahy_A07g035950 [Arachis hypogaea]